ncbi:TPA: hypothetical protein ACHWJ6_001001 [Streptococcus suis]
MAHTINYSGNLNKFGEMTYVKKDIEGNVIYETLDDIFRDPDFDMLVSEL